MPLNAAFPLSSGALPDLWHTGGPAREHWPHGLDEATWGMTVLPRGPEKHRLGGVVSWGQIQF